MTWRIRVTWAALRYHLLVYRRESLWLPAGLWALCALIVFFFRADTRGIEMSGAYLAYVLPLSAGVLASGAVLGAEEEDDERAKRPEPGRQPERLAPVDEHVVAESCPGHAKPPGHARLCCQAR